MSFLDPIVDALVANTFRHTLTGVIFVFFVISLSYLWSILFILGIYLNEILSVIIFDIKDLKIWRVLAFTFFSQSLYSGKGVKCYRIAPQGHGLDGTSGQEHAKAGQEYTEVEHKHAEAEHKYNAQGVKSVPCIFIYSYFCVVQKVCPILITFFYAASYYIINLIKRDC